VFFRLRRDAHGVHAACHDEVNRVAALFRLDVELQQKLKI